MITNTKEWVKGLILKNDPQGTGAYIEDVIDDAFQRRIFEEHILDLLRDLKASGEAYEPRIGRIRIVEGVA